MKVSSSHSQKGMTISPDNVVIGEGRNLNPYNSHTQVYTELPEKCPRTGYSIPQCPFLALAEDSI